MRFRVWSILTSLLLVVGTAEFTGPAVLAHGAHSTAFSGFELFPGYPNGGTTLGTSFGGWTHDGAGWQPPANGGQSRLGASVDYSGKPGLNSAVAITGGYWGWRAPNGTVHAGQVRDGQVVWPVSLTDDIGCGAGIAKFSANLVPDGTLSGCLDDTHLSSVFPPRVWGTLLLR